MAIRLFLVLLTAGLLSAQTLQVNVTLQQIVTTVRDANGALVRDLGPPDFIVELDGVRQPIVQVSQDANVPISVGLIVDASNWRAR